MASTKKVSFSPNTAETKPSKATSSDATSLVENDFLDRPTILRVKRKRSELPLDIIVIEAEQPIRKKKTMQALTEALASMKVAHELREQFESEMKTKAAQTTTQSESSISSATIPPPSVWSAPSKTLENKMRKLFRLIGTDDSSSADSAHVATIVNDAQSGRAHKRDIINALSVRSYEKERKARAEEVRRKVAETRSFHLRRVVQPVAVAPGEPIPTEDDELCRILELVSEEDAARERASEPKEPTAPTQIAATGGLRLPVVHSARKLKEIEAQRALEAEKEVQEFVTAFYVLDEEAGLGEIGEFNTVQVPISQFKEQLLDEFVLEGEYSDEDREGDSSDSQNKSEDWEYGSDPEEENGGKSSGSEEEEEEAEEEAAEDDVDEIMDEMGEYHHRSYLRRGYDLEIDPNEDMAGSEDDEDYD